VDRLRTLAADSSRFVGGTALMALATVDSSAALPLIHAALERPSWIDLDRKYAAAALSVFRPAASNHATPATP
jgi:hypothetical protein